MNTNIGRYDRQSPPDAVSTNIQIKTFTVFEEHRPRQPIVSKEMVIVSPLDLLGDIVTKVVKDNTKYKDFERSRILKISWGTKGITQLLDISLQVIEQNFSPENKMECITIRIKTSDTPRKTVSVFARMFAAQRETLRFLQHNEDLSFDFLECNAKKVLEIDATEAHEEAMEMIQATNLQCQIKSLLQSLFCQIGLGFRNKTEESMLKTFVCSYSNVLCFVEKHWKSFFRADFPCIPPMHQTCMSLQLLALTNRK